MISSEQFLKVIIPAFLLILVLSCSKTISTPSSSEQNYYEDLSYLHDSVSINTESKSQFYLEKEGYGAVVPQFDLKYEMDSVLRIIQDSRKSVTFLNGYTIVIYSGNSREAANDSKKKVTELFENYKPDIAYIQPNFKVSVGKFYDRLEANRVYKDIKKEFPSALVLPERIYFKQQ